MAKKKLTEWELKQLELKERYMEIIRKEVWPGSQSMQNYAYKKFGNAVELANGDLYVEDKPSINTDLCFGYGYSGVSTKEEYDAANRASENAATNVDYFIERNLRDLEWKLDLLYDPRYEKYKYIKYSTQPAGSKLKGYTCCRMYDNPTEAPYRWSNHRDLEKMTDEEVDALIECLKKTKEMFTKRLNTYLKRYGLSKLNVWTYLRD